MRCTASKEPRGLSYPVLIGQNDDPYLPSRTGILEPIGGALVLSVVITKNAVNFRLDDHRGV